MVNSLRTSSIAATMFFRAAIISGQVLVLSLQSGLMTNSFWSMKSKKDFILVYISLTDGTTGLWISYTPGPKPFW